MTAHILVDMNIHDPEGYSAYPPRVIPLIEKHGGRVTHRIGGCETLEGGWDAKRMIVIEFPDRAAARAFWDDPEYVPVKEIRLKTSHSRIILGESP